MDVAYLITKSDIQACATYILFHKSATIQCCGCRPKLTSYTVVCGSKTTKVNGTKYKQPSSNKINTSLAIVLCWLWWGVDNNENGKM